jgi:hypothetical protein
VKEFAGQDNIVFGDVNLQESKINDPKYGVGAGGWPTVRFFNADTGYDGKAYEQKTKKSMCDELGGDGEYLRTFVNDFSTPPCTVRDQAHCPEKEKEFIAKFAAKTSTEQATELSRLEKLISSPAVSGANLKNFKTRAKLLTMMITTPAEAGVAIDPASHADL